MKRERFERYVNCGNYVEKGKEDAIYIDVRGKSDIREKQDRSCDGNDDAYMSAKHFWNSKQAPSGFFHNFFHNPSGRGATRRTDNSNYYDKSPLILLWLHYATAD
eukprot:scaffold1973_cov72-Cylindrotheca_fusiformis.AAC.1